MTTTPNRQAQRRAATRSKLLRAAYELAAEKEAANVSVTDITSRADLGTGTFYNHFSSREEIFQVAAEESFEQVGRALDASISHLEDSAEVWSASLRYLARFATNDRVWGWFFINMGAVPPVLMTIFGPRAHRDLTRGVEENRMTINNIDVAVVCTFGALYGAVQHGLTTNITHELDSTFARAMLRMVGIPDEEAGHIASLPLPQITIPEFFYPDHSS